MRALLGCASLLLAFGIAQAVPARPLYVPAEVQKAPAPPSFLAGTVWRGMLFDNNSRIAFLADGTLTYGEPGSTTPGSWRLDGLKLYFEINRYSEYDTILSGDIIQGEGWNKAGMRCKPLLRREYGK